MDAYCSQNEFESSRALMRISLTKYETSIPNATFLGQMLWRNSEPWHTREIFLIDSEKESKRPSSERRTKGAEWLGAR